MKLQRKESFADRFKGRTTTIDKSGVTGVIISKGQAIDKNIPDYTSNMDTETDVLTPITRQANKQNKKPQKQPGFRNAPDQQENQGLSKELDLRQGVDSYKDSNGNKRYYTKTQKEQDLSISYTPQNFRNNYQQNQQQQNLLYTQQLPPQNHFGNTNSNNNQDLYSTGGYNNNNFNTANSPQNNGQYMPNQNGNGMGTKKSRISKNKPIQSAQPKNFIKDNKISNKPTRKTNSNSNINVNNNNNQNNYNNNNNNNFNNKINQRDVQNISQYNDEEYQLIAVPKKFLQNQEQYNQFLQNQTQNSNIFNPNLSTIHNNNMNTNMGSMNSIYSSMNIGMYNNNMNTNISSNPSFIRQSQNILGGNPSLQQTMNSNYSKFNNNQQNNYNNHLHYSEKNDLATSYLNSQKNYQENPFGQQQAYNGNQIIGKYNNGNFNATNKNSQFGANNNNKNMKDKDFVYQLDEIENKHYEIIQSMNNIGQKNRSNQDQIYNQKPRAKFNY